MADPAFTPEMTKALDSYVVPTLPTGFSDRLMARIASGDTGQAAAMVTALSARKRPSNPWRRTSRIIGSVALFSLATATAAAAGVFGDPVYLPGISEALVQAKIVEEPKHKVKPKAAMIANNASPAVATDPAVPQPKGSAAVVSRLTEMREDPRYANLTPKQKFVVAGREVRSMVRSGEVTREEARTAVREMVNDADPETKAKVRQALEDRRAKRLERRAQLQNATPEERAAFRQALRERRDAVQSAAPVEPETPPQP